MPRGGVQLDTPEFCPVCGEDVPVEAKFCPGCGADHETGWKDEASETTYDLPDDDFDYKATIEREFESGVRPYGIKPIWWITAIILVVVFAGAYLARLSGH